MSTKESIISAISAANKILVIQADNPDSDSLGSALALESILGEQGKYVWMYCGVDIPMYLRYFSGWDRVTAELPSEFDLSIIVDTSSSTLLQKLDESGKKGWVAARPCIVIDHHNETATDISFATEWLNNEHAPATADIIYSLAKEASWPLTDDARRAILSAILGDTQGLSNDLATPDTYRTVADFIEQGISRVELEEKRKEYGKMARDIYKFKGELLLRTEFELDGLVAHVTISQDEINKYSPLYNPAPLVQADMLQTEGVGIALVFKQYADGKILCAIRCNQQYPVGTTLAKEFGGGGHPYASGFKILDGRRLQQIKSECIRKISDILTTTA